MNASRAIAALAIMACPLGPHLSALHAEQPGPAGVLTVSGTVVLEDGARPPERSSNIVAPITSRASR